MKYTTWKENDIEISKVDIRRPDRIEAIILHWIKDRLGDVILSENLNWITFDTNVMFTTKKDNEYGNVVVDITVLYHYTNILKFHLTNVSEVMYSVEIKDLTSVDGGFAEVVHQADEKEKERNNKKLASYKEAIDFKKQVY